MRFGENAKNFIAAKPSKKLETAFWYKYKPKLQAKSTY